MNLRNPRKSTETPGDLVQEESFPPVEVSNKAPDTSPSSAVTRKDLRADISARCDRQSFSGGIQIALQSAVYTVETVCQIILESLGAQIGAQHI